MKDKYLTIDHFHETHATKSFVGCKGNPDMATARYAKIAIVKISYGAGATNYYIARNQVTEKKLEGQFIKVKTVDDEIKLLSTSHIVEIDMGTTMMTVYSTSDEPGGTKIYENRFLVEDGGTLRVR